MARQRIYALQPGGLTDDAVDVWGEPAIRTSLVAVGDPDVDARIQSTQVLRIRHRDDVDIRSVLREGRNLWFVTELAEVGQRRWLDLSIVSYALVQSTRPADTDPYTAQAGYTLALEGSAVQYLQIWEVNNPDAENTLERNRMILRNYGAAGMFPAASLQCQAPNGARGELQVPSGSTSVPRVWDRTVTADDELIPESRISGLARWGFQWVTTVDTRAARRQSYTPRVLDWLRVLSTEELA